MRLNNFFLGIIFSVILISCSTSKKINTEIEKHFYTIKNSDFDSLSVDSFLKKLSHLSLSEREDSLINYMSKGWMPAYNFSFKKISFEHKNASGKKIKVSFWAAPDYLSIGKNENFVRMPLSPQAAQVLADQFHCVLPTTKMVDEIYKTAKLKLAPIPLTEKRDSLISFIAHNKLIKAQLVKKIPNEIVVGIKKDVVQSTAVLNHPKPNRVVIYGWHKLDGKPIQPLFAGHVDWYVDYSHGIRLIYEKMLINNKIYFVKDVLNNPELAETICDDTICSMMRYKKREID